MNYILVVGPGATQSNGKQPRLYWHTLFAAIISWCVESGIIETPQRENELRQLLKRDALFSLGYILEEYLSDKAEIQRCLKDVLQNIAHSSNLQQQLMHLPFRGFISTTYDITIETEYEQIYHKDLAKFYGSSLQNTLDAYQQGQPFLLKLYGDIEYADSLVFGHRWSKGPTCLSDLALFHSLVSASPVLFYGFDEDDNDYKYVKAIIDEHSPFNEMSLTISHVQEEQSQDGTPFKWNEFAGHNGSLSSLSPLTLSHAVKEPEVGIKTSSYNHYGNEIDHNRIMYNVLTTIQELPIQSRLARRGPIEIYTIYTENDARYYKNMQNYVFSVLKNLYNISCLDNEVMRSNDWRRKNHLLTATLILPLVSLSFIASDIWKCEQMAEAIQKHHDGDAYIIPILVHPADSWKSTTLKDLDALPDNGRAISKWSNKQDAYNNIVNYLIELLKRLSFG